MTDPGLNGKVALITGANSPYGIRAAAARAFAAQGAAVFITYLRQHIDLSPQAAKALDAAGAPGEAFYQASQRLAAETVVEEIRAAGGRVAAIEPIWPTQPACRCCSNTPSKRSAQSIC